MSFGFCHIRRIQQLSRLVLGFFAAPVVANRGLDIGVAGYLLHHTDVSPSVYKPPTNVQRKSCGDKSRALARAARLANEAIILFAKTAKSHCVLHLRWVCRQRILWAFAVLGQLLPHLCQVSVRRIDTPGGANVLMSQVRLENCQVHSLV